jgi:hypothetical protein
MASKRPTIFDVRDHMNEHREKYMTLGSVAMHVFEVIKDNTLYAPRKAQEYGWVTAEASKVRFLVEQTGWADSAVREALKALSSARLIEHVYDPFSKAPGRGNPKRIRNNIAHLLLAERQRHTEKE